MHFSIFAIFLHFLQNICMQKMAKKTHFIDSQKTCIKLQIFGTIHRYWLMQNSQELAKWWKMWENFQNFQNWILFKKCKKNYEKLWLITISWKILRRNCINKVIKIVIFCINHIGMQFTSIFAVLRTNHLSRQMRYWKK